MIDPVECHIPCKLLFARNILVKLSVKTLLMKGANPLDCLQLIHSCPFQNHFFSRFSSNSNIKINSLTVQLYISLVALK